MKKYFLIISSAILLAVILFVSYANLVKRPVEIIQVAQDNFGISIVSLKPGEAISSPLKITGVVNGGGWIGFEAQVGVVRLFDDKDNELALGLLTAKGEWMQIKIDFETELNFIAPKSGDGKLVFYNENPSGEPIRDKTFVLPIKFKK